MRRSAILLLLPACAFAIADPMRFDIPSQPLQTALRAFADQSKMQLLYRGDAVVGTTSRPVVGDFERRAALEKLLENTGLEVVFSEGDAATIRPKSAARTPATSALPTSYTRIAQAEGSSQSSSTSNQNAPADVSSARLEEVTVTAQKRGDERLHRVPISISVLGGSTLDRSPVEGVAEALERVPGVTLSGVGGNNTTIAVRGVGPASGFYSGATTTAYYLDSVPFGFVKSAFSPDANAYDMERVEVLRGPQGTLYGANSVNGVVKVLTHDANPDAFELKMRTALMGLQDGDLGGRGDLAVNVPLLEGALGARAVLGYEKRGGWIDTLTDENANDARLRNYRLRFKGKVSDNLTLGASAWVSRKNYGLGLGSDDSYRYPKPVLQDQSEFSDFDTYGFTANWDTASVAVTSNTSYIDYQSGQGLDLSIGRLTTDMRSQVLSEELLLSSVQKGASWGWSLGGFYRDAEDLLIQVGSNGWPVTSPTNFTDTSKSFALFGELRKRFLEDELELTGGWRYFQDDVEQIENTPVSGDPNQPLQHVSDTFSAWTPRFVLTWFPTERNTAYVSYSQGFRSGFNQNAYVHLAAAGFPPIRPDKLTNYEIGAKGRSVSGLLSYEASLYYIDWKDIQQSLAVAYSGSFVVGSVNGQSASGAGLDLALTLHPTSGLELGLTLSYNDLELDDRVFSGGVQLFDKGDRLNNSPEYTLFTFLDYTFPLASSGFSGTLSASANLLAKNENRTLEGATLLRTDGDDLTIARVGFRLSAPQNWEATLFIENVTNESARIIASTDPIEQQLTTPRTYGVQLDYRF